MSFNSQITFVYIETHSSKAWEFCYQIDCAYIRSYLAEMGVSSIQYIEQNLSCVYGQAANIAAISNNKVIFYVDESNFEISKIISNEIKRFHSAIDVYWFGLRSPRVYKKLMKDVQLDVYINYNFEETIYKLVTTEKERFHEIDGIIFRKANGLIVKRDTDILFRKKGVSMDQINPPYQSRIIPLNQLSRVGIKISHTDSNNENNVMVVRSHSLQRIFSDLDYLEERTNKSNLTIKLYADSGIFTNRFFGEELLRGLIDRQYSFEFRIQIDLDYVSKKLLQLLSQSRVYQY